MSGLGDACRKLSMAAGSDQWSMLKCLLGIVVVFGGKQMDVGGEGRGRLRSPTK